MPALVAPFVTSGEFLIDYRMEFKTLSEMYSFGKNKSTALPDTFIAVCHEDHNLYVYNKVNKDSATGGWTLIGNGGEGGSSYLTSAITTTTAWGGIPKGTTLSAGTNFENIFSSALSPYVGFNFTSISTSASAGNYEYGKEVTISAVKPTFTSGSNPINSVKIGTSSGGSELYSGSTITSNTITLTNKKTFNGTTGGTIYCTLSDGKNTKTNSASVSYVYYVYYAVTNDNNPPSAWNKATNYGLEAEIITSYTEGQYLWLAFEKSKTAKEIQVFNPLTKSWSHIGEDDGTTKSENTFKLKLETNVEADYYSYRSTKPMAGNGNDMKFRLKENN